MGSKASLYRLGSAVLLKINNRLSPQVFTWHVSECNERWLITMWTPYEWCVVGSGACLPYESLSAVRCLAAPIVFIPSLPWLNWHLRFAESAGLIAQNSLEIFLRWTVRRAGFRYGAAHQRNFSVVVAELLSHSERRTVVFAETDRRTRLPRTPTIWLQIFCSPTACLPSKLKKPPWYRMPGKLSVRIVLLRVIH